MLSTYSPQREGSGMMQLHSPPHDHKSQYDPHSAISEIRRSLSRSPSKPYNFRSPPIGSNFIYTPSPLSPPRRPASEHVLHFNSISPHITRSTQTGRIQRPALRRTVQTTGVSRIRTSPKSPSKRTFMDTYDSAPQFQPLRKRRSTELEDDDMDLMDSEDKENFFKHGEDPMNSWKATQMKQDKGRNGGLLTEIAPLSPMKRPDSITNHDQTPLGSPSAKRRSVHVSSTMDFSIFESDNLRDESHDKRSRDDHDWFRNIPMSPSTRFSTIPKRSSSLRKSTLQQRQSDKSSPLRLNNFAEFRQSWMDSTPMNKRPSRTSLDVNLLTQPRDSPFSNPGFLLNASIHPVQSSQEGADHDLQNKHPLATATAPPSSSTASVQDDSPTHEPVRRFDKPRSHDFSKSLPIGAMRPPQIPQLGSQEFSSQGSFATPAAYKAAKPLPAAFMSTGLISKKNRNVDEPDAGLPKAHMPDTPCKKQSTTFAKANETFKPTNATIHNLRASFGTPKSPSEVPFGITRVTPFPWARSTSIFSTRAKQSLARKASFASIASIEVDDKPNSQSPSAPVESQSTDGGFPPTPTKHITLAEARAASVSPSPQHIMSKPFAPSSIQVSKYANVSPHSNEIPHSSPHTPLESIFPPDPSSLSISGRGDRPSTRHSNDQFSALPATPTGPREYFNNFSNRPSLNLGAPEVADVDASLTSRFDKVDLVGTGEFSQVYRVSEPPETSPFHKVFTNGRPASRNSLPGKVWAVKKSRHAYSGPKDRARKVHEVDILKTLGHNDHVINFVDSWEDRGHLYIQTEFCEEGTLDVFLAQSGSRARLDDFRIWKILLELSLGMKHIHDMGYIHLDLKPANILITFEGVLKIGDFGMATKWPAKAGIEGEGDREYIGPEILMGRYDKPADVFALGLIMLETAGNVELPDNGASWQKLRSGDMSDVPSLTWSSEDSNILRDASGNPLMDEEEEDAEVILSNDDSVVTQSSASKATCMIRRGELLQPPSFMTDASNEQSLDAVVRWMISPNPDDRPTIDLVLQSKGVQWAESRRRAGATIFEGNWGPADEILAEDAEMIDV